MFDFTFWPSVALLRMFRVSTSLQNFCCDICVCRWPIFVMVHRRNEEGSLTPDTARVSSTVRSASASCSAKQCLMCIFAPDSGKPAGTGTQIYQTCKVNFVHVSTCEHGCHRRQMPKCKFCCAHISSTSWPGFVKLIRKYKACFSDAYTSFLSFLVRQDKVPSGA